MTVDQPNPTNAIVDDPTQVSVEDDEPVRHIDLNKREKNAKAALVTSPGTMLRPTIWFKTVKYGIDVTTQVAHQDMPERPKFLRAKAAKFYFETQPLLTAEVHYRFRLMEAGLSRVAQEFYLKDTGHLGWVTTEIARPGRAGQIVWIDIVDTTNDTVVASSAKLMFGRG